MANNPFDDLIGNMFGGSPAPAGHPANDAAILTQALPAPGPCADRATLGLWFKLFARDCRAALPKAAT